MVDRRAKQEEGTDSSADGFRIGASAVTLPKGGGSIRGIGERFAANPNTGPGSFTVLIASIPGRSDFGPQLSLSYGSASAMGLPALVGAFRSRRSLASPTRDCPSIRTRMSPMSLSLQPRNTSFLFLLKVRPGKGLLLAIDSHGQTSHHNPVWRTL